MTLRLDDLSSTSGSVLCLIFSFIYGSCSKESCISSSRIKPWKHHRTDVIWSSYWSFLCCLCSVYLLVIRLSPVPLLLSISLLTSIYAVISVNKLPAWQLINMSLTLIPLNLPACFVLAGDLCVCWQDRNFNHYSCACCEMQLSSCWISYVVHWGNPDLLTLFS